MRPNLTPRAILALSTAGVSLFLLLCFSGYGSREAASAMPAVGWSDTIAGWFIRPLGAGAHVIAALGLVWGVIVYFQERTPDLVLRMVGVTALAASTAMIVGLAKGGHDSVWAGTVGTAVAREIVSAGTLGTVLGWLLFPALGIVSLFFATDWLFHTLRRGDRPRFDPRKLPTEPSRGDLLDEPADAEPREFIPATSRAAEHVESIEFQPPKPVEVLAETLPKGFSAAPVGDLGGRTMVRGPSGYDGVEFLPASDELAVPAAIEEPALHAAEDHEIVASHGFEIEYFDAPLEGGELVAEPPAPVAPAAPPVAVAPAAAASEPATGIGYADESILVDEVYAMPASFDDTLIAHDGASAADEVRSNWSTDEIAPSPATDQASAEPLSSEIQPSEIQPREVEVQRAAPPMRASRIAGPQFEDEVMFGETPFEDDVLVWREAPAETLAAESPAPSFEPSAHIAEASAPSAVATLAPVAVAAPAPVAMIEAPAPVAIEAPVPVVAPTAIEAVDTDWVVDESLLASAPAAEVAAVDVPAVAAPVDAAAMLAESLAAAIAAVEPMEMPKAPAPVVVEAPAIAEVPAAVVVVETVESAASPAPVETPAAPVVVAEVPAAVAPAQLGLFPAPAFDASKLAGMDLDPLFSEAAKAILSRNRASAVVLQRALGIGYARGLRILDQMTAAGMLGPDSPGGARDIGFSEPPI